MATNCTQLLLLQDIQSVKVYFIAYLSQKLKEAKLNLGYTYSGASNWGELDFLDIESKSHNFFGSVSRRLVKTDNYKLYGDIGLDIRNTKTDIWFNS